jgi:hypothetical protein
MHRRARTAASTLLIAAAALAACACSSGGYRYRYQPMPVGVQVHTASGTHELMLISVLGATRPEGGGSDEIHVRVRLQNATAAPLRLPVEKQRLLSGDLLEFPSPRLIGGTPEAAPGGNALADLAFSWPPDATPDLRGLSLSWVLEVDGKEVGNTVTFQRVYPGPPAYVGPAWGAWGPYGAYGAYGPYGPYGWHGYHGH